jgi:hypothetical protein
MPLFFGFSSQTSELPENVVRQMIIFCFMVNFYHGSWYLNINAWFQGTINGCVGWSERSANGGVP